MTDLRLGKREATEDRRDFRFARIAETLPTPPARFGHGLLFHRTTGWGMLGNGPDDTVEPGFPGAGDCVFAGAAHKTMLWNHLAYHDVTFTGRNAIDDYSAVTGYVIGDDSTDQGTYVREALEYRRKTGVVDARGRRHTIAAYVALDPGNWEHLIQAAYVFGAVGIGFEFPETAMDQFFRGEPWDVVEGAQVVGGHYVPIVGRNAASFAGALSWGRRVGMSRAFYERYCDEAWGILSLEEMRADGKNERGFDVASLQAALEQLRG